MTWRRLAEIVSEASCWRRNAYGNEVEVLDAERFKDLLRREADKEEAEEKAAEEDEEELNNLANERI